MKWSLVKCQNINEKMDSETEHHKIPITKNSPSLSATFATLSIGDWKSFFFLLFRLLHFSVDCTRAAPTVGYMFHAPISLSTIKSASNNNKKVWKVEMKQEKKIRKNYNYQEEICVVEIGRENENTFFFDLFHYTERADEAQQWGQVRISLDWNETAVLLLVVRMENNLIWLRGAARWWWRRNYFESLRMWKFAETLLINLVCNSP